jgi:putative component of toxin-antitoxin plasmid stabilization module
MYELLHYQDEDGTDLFAKWLDGLADRRAQALALSKSQLPR